MPRYRVAREGEHFLADEAIAFSAGYALTADEWQELIVRDWQASDRSGRLIHDVCGLSVPRQNGKNGTIEIVELHRMVAMGRRILHTAHEVKTARKAYLRMKHFFGSKANDPHAHFPELNALVVDVRSTNGQEAVLLSNGGGIEFVARSAGSGRGFTVDDLVIDEAQHLTDEELEALRSVISSAPSGNSQIIYTGTPPGPKVSGEVFTRVRTAALADAAKPAARCWHEWSCERGVDPSSHEAWYFSNPSLGVRHANGAFGLSLAAVEGEALELSEDGFMRERLGMWEQASTTAVIDPVTWGLCADPSSVATDCHTLAIDVAPDRTVSSVALAGRRDDGRWHVELAENRSGTAWIVGYVSDLCARNRIRAVVIDGASPAASLVDEFTRSRVRVTVTGPREMAAACGQFFDAVNQRSDDGEAAASVCHTDQPQVNVALANGRKRTLGDAWAWNRRHAESDITPLVAVTLALWGARNSKVTRPGRGVGARSGRTSSSRTSTSRRSAA